MPQHPPDRSPEPPPALAPWQQRMHEIIFEADTPAGKTFDVLLIAAIVLSVAAVMLESVTRIRMAWGPQLLAIEWFFTLLFTAEYIARLICVQRPWRYAISFFGVVDLLAILPTYLSLLVGGTQSLLVIRALRLVRIFRVFKLAHHLTEASALVENLRRMRAKITVFLVVVLSMIVVIGALMYLIEGSQPNSKFTSIPRSIYWAIVTMTTVGYGDISPQTEVGQALAAVTMILGYSIIIVPTGLFTVGLAGSAVKAVSTQACPNCSAEGHDMDAVFCKYCGARL
ncbi:MAG: ion transporter [Planctomycetota bacterium]|nr:ion transporter [Planctomycetota bacterium]